MGMKQVYFARGDAACGTNGALHFVDPRKQPIVELIFKGETETLDIPCLDLPCEKRRVLVDGVERYFWVEMAGQLKPRPDLRKVQGHDLRSKPVRVITTDDGRRYAFLADPAYSREVAEALPHGRRRLIPSRLEAPASG